MTAISVETQGTAQTRARLPRVLAAITALLCAAALVACQPTGHQKKTKIHETEDSKAALETFTWPAEPSHVIALEIEGRGTIRVGLYEQFAPITVAHVVDLATQGVYDDTLFHRVIEDFVIQGGDPATRKRGPDTTRGDWADLRVEDEYGPVHLDRGVIAMANRGRPGSAASQFFIVIADQREMDGRYTAFGRVIDGMDVVDGIALVETDKFGRWGKKDKPLENVILVSVAVEGVGGVVGDGGARAGDRGDSAADSAAGSPGEPGDEMVGIAQRG